MMRKRRITNIPVVFQRQLRLGSIRLGANKRKRRFLFIFRPLRQCCRGATPRRKIPGRQARGQESGVVSDLFAGFRTVFGAATGH
jgi:hypothetical protein